MWWLDHSFISLSVRLSWFFHGLLFVWCLVFVCSAVLASPEEDWGKMLALSQTPATTLPAVEAESIMTEHKLLGYQERFIRLQAFLKKCDDDEQDLLQGEFKSLDFSRYLISPFDAFLFGGTNPLSKFLSVHPCGWQLYNHFQLLHEVAMQLNWRLGHWVSPLKKVLSELDFVSPC
jgi:hypothetical protein